MEWKRTMARMSSLLGRWTSARVLLVAIAASVATSSCGSAEEPGEAAQVPESPQAEAVSQKLSISGVVAYAGMGSPRFKGDGGPASEAGMYQPTGVAVDIQGNVYISTDHRVRRVDGVTGVITTMAGTGKNRTGGDGGPAAEATLAEPKGLVLDGVGNLFIVENGGSRVRRVDGSTGVITTVAGGGFGNPREKIFGDGKQATEAFLKNPDDIAVDNRGSLYIATDNRIRKVDATTGVIATVAGTGERGLEGDGGPATSAGLAEPKAVEVDNQGNILIVDSENHRIRKVEAATGIMTTLAGIGKHYERTSYAYQGLATINSPEYDASRAAASGAGYAGDGGPANQAMLQTPSAIGLDGAGNIFIGDGGVRVRKVDAATGVITTVAAGDTETTAFEGKIQVLTTSIGAIVSMAVSDQGDLFLADFKKNLVHKIATVAP